MTLRSTLLLLALPGVALAVPPEQLPLQGFLTDDAGVAIDGSTDLRFRVYTTATATTAEVDATVTVDVDNGAFSVYLDVPSDLYVAQDDLYLGVAVGTGAEMTPRARLGTAPYAARAVYADEAGLVEWADVENVPADLADGDANPVYTGSDGVIVTGTAIAGDKPVFEGWAKAIAYDTPAELTTALTGMYVAYQACPSGDVLSSNGSAWACTNPTALPISEAAVDAAVLNNGYAAATSLTSLTARVATAEATITTLQGSMTTAQSSISTLQGGLTTAQANVATLQGSMTTAQASISALQSGLTAAQGNVAALTTSVTALQATAPLIGTVPHLPGASCRDIKTRFVNAPDGIYWIDLDGGNPSNGFQALCDMTTNGGGWTLVQQAVPVTNASVQLCSAGAVGSLDLTNASVTGPAKLANTAINTMWSSNKEILVKYDEGNAGAGTAAYDRVCKVDFRSGYTWNTATAAQNLGDLDTTAITCYVGTNTVAVSPYAGPTCGYAYNLAAGEYALQTFDTTYTPTGYGCTGAPNAGRTWLGVGNAGCNMTKTFIR